MASDFIYLTTGSLLLLSSRKVFNRSRIGKIARSAIIEMMVLLTNAKASIDRKQIFPRLTRKTSNPVRHALADQVDMLDEFRNFDEKSISFIFRKIREARCAVRRNPFRQRDAALVIHLVHRTDLMTLCSTFFYWLARNRAMTGIDRIAFLRTHYFKDAEDAMLRMCMIGGFEIDVVYLDQKNVGLTLLNLLKSPNVLFLNMIDVLDHPGSSSVRFLGREIHTKTETYRLAQRVCAENYSLHWTDGGFELCRCYPFGYQVVFKRYEREFRKYDITWANWIDHVYAKEVLRRYHSR